MNLNKNRGLLAVCSAYVVFQVINIVWVGSSLTSSRILNFNDSLVFIRASKEGWFSSGLWAETYPFSYPVVLKLFGSSLPLYLLQAGVAVLAWVWLAIEVSRATASRILGTVGAAWLLVVSLAPEISGWHQVIMTESLSSSGLVGLVALALAFGRTRSTTLLYVAVPVTIWWIQLRQSNLLVLGGFVLVLAVWALRTRRRQVGAVAVLGMVVVGAALSLNAGYNSYLSVKWVVTTGINDPDAREFLVERGMPDSAAVLDLGSDDLYRDRLESDPRLDEFRDWLVDDSSSVYAAWLTDDPARFVTEVFRSFEVSLLEEDKTDDFQGVLNSVREARGDGGATNWTLGLSVGSVVWVRPHPYLVAWIVLSLLGVGVVQWKRPSAIGDSRWNVGWFLVLLSPLLIVAAAYADTADRVRHTLGAATQLRIGLVLLAVWAVDNYQKTAQRPQPDGPLTEADPSSARPDRSISHAVQQES